MTEDSAKIKLNKLMYYAKKNLWMEKADKYYVLNSLLDLFGFDAPAPDNSDENHDFNIDDVQSEIIDPLVDYAIQKKLTTKEERILFETKMMGLITPAPSAVNRKFDEIEKKEGKEAATDALFKLSKANNYLRMCDINKNIKWRHHGSLGDIEITINLSKPEKDPKEIALAKSLPQSGYPACMLCASNLGFAGNLNHPARQTLRYIPITLTNEQWYMQFSPYQYYREHLIAFSEQHRPMAVTADSLKRLIEFTDIFPHYFIGSNAALPIVGGSILTHDHYQGGSKVLPMFKAESRRQYKSENFKDLKIEIANWYNSVIRISGQNANSVHKFSSLVLEKWRDWTDESVEIIAKTTEEHNAITPIARNENGRYIFDMILRNNRTDEKRPYGIFHPEERLHNIKKEGIGIIEVMGLFILPGRLKNELHEAEKFLIGEKEINDKALTDPKSNIYKHRNMILELIEAHGRKNTKEDAKKFIIDKINHICEEILEYTAVFKNTEKGQNAFDRFMTEGLNLSKA